MLRPSKKVVDFDAYQSAKGIMIGFKRDSNAYFCSMPLPDYALNREISLDPKVEKDSTIKYSIDMQTQYKSNVVELRNRENSLYMMREALFNLCVAGSRSNLDSKQYLERFDLVVKLAFAQKNEAVNDSSITQTSNSELKTKVVK